MKVHSGARLLAGCCVLLLIQQVAPAFGASSRSSRSSSSRSSRSSSSRSYTRSRGGTSYSRMSTFVTASFAWSVKFRAHRYGYYFSSQYWRMSHSSLESSTSICFNIQDSVPSEYNSSVMVPWIYQNRTTYGLFICPIDGREDKSFCCGTDEAEYCCGFWEDGGRIAGVSVGAVLGLVGISLLIYVCVSCAKGAAAGSSAVAAKPISEAPPAYPGYDNYYNTQYSSQQHAPKDEPPQVFQQVETSPPPRYEM